MNFVYQCKVVGLSFHKVENAVEQGDFVILVANPENEHDSDCIEVYNAERELVGYIANSDKTLSVQNISNGNLSASQLKEVLGFGDYREYYAEAVRVYRSCIYLELNDGHWSYNRPIEDNSDNSKGGENMNDCFISLRDLCRSPLTVELMIDLDGDFSVYFEDEGIGFKYKVVECEGVKGVNL